MDQELIKQDINFLEHPIWFQNETFANQQEDGYIWKDMEGYVYKAGYKPPVKTDIIFLMFLMLKSQKNEWVDKLEFTRYEALKKCGLTATSPKFYARLEDSLKRWEYVRIEFSGTFYDNKTYKTLHFGIIDAWGIDDKTKKLWVQLSQTWLLRAKNSNYFKMLNFETLKKLSSPLDLRLHEILVKNFQNRLEWQIDSIKLAEKIPMAKKYASQIKVEIEPSVKRIYTKTDLKVKLESVKKERGKILFIFRKEAENAAQAQPNSNSSSIFIHPTQSPPPIIDQALIKSFTFSGTDPELVRQTIAEFGVESVTEIHTAFLSHLKRTKNGKGKKIDDPAAYYARCLRNRFGVKTPEQRQAAKDKIARIEKQRQEKAHKEAMAVHELQAARNEAERLERLVAALSESDYERLRALAIKLMPQSMVKVKASIKNRMKSLVEDFVAGKLDNFGCAEA